MSKMLKKKAEENARVTKETSRNQEVLKEGVPNDHSRKHLQSNLPVVGANLGLTKNMENYESLRVDVWLSDEVQEGETIQQVYARIVKIIDETLRKVVSQYTDK